MAYDAPKAEGRKVKVPDGYKDEAEFLAEVRELFDQGVDFDRLNRDEAVADLKFLAGDQWTDEAKKAFDGKPMLTINDLPAKVAQVVGDMRINKPAIRVRPAEDADKDLAEIREGLIRAIERDCDAQGVYISTAESQVACGIGNFRISLKNADDFGFERDIRFEAIPDPFAVVWDPFSTERTGKDAEHALVVDQLSRKTFNRTWKDKLPSDLEVPGGDVGGWYTRDEVRVAEFWQMKNEPTTYARLESGATVEVEAGQMIRRTGKGKKLVPLLEPIAVDEDGAPMVREGTRRYACMYLVTGSAILSGPHELPIPRVPIFRVRGWEVNVREKRVRFGLIRFARDPARLKNYWRSQSAQMLALAGNGKWLLHESNEGDQDAFRDAHAADDPVLTWSGQVKPEYVGPPTLNSAVLQEAALCSQDMKDVTGLHDASLGAKSNETSGKAILARQKEGDVSTFIYHDNLQAAIGEGGKVANILIPVAYDTARTIRTVGEDETTKVQRVNDPNDPESVDLNRGRYDVVVETGPSYSTKRAEASESMMQFVQAVPSAAQAAGDLIAKSQDWPGADLIAERLKKTLPPGLAETDDEDMTPEQQQAKAGAMQQAQQQQQMQQEAAQVALDGEKAKVALTIAQARKLGSEATANTAPAEGDPQVAQALAMMELRTATANAEKAEHDARKAGYEADRAKIGIVADEVKVEGDLMDLERKPLEQAHSEADLDIKLNPPPAEKPQA